MKDKISLDVFMIFKFVIANFKTYRINPLQAKLGDIIRRIYRSQIKTGQGMFTKI